MSKDLTTIEFTESIKKCFQNKALLAHSERKQPNTASPTDNQAFVARANSQVSEYVSIVTAILDEKSK